MTENYYIKRWNSSLSPGVRCEVHCLPWRYLIDNLILIFAAACLSLPYLPLAWCADASQAGVRSRECNGHGILVGTRPISWSLRRDRHGRLSGNVVTSHVVKPKEIVF